MNTVVIAGAGPVGLFLACELKAYGIGAIVLERRTSIDPMLKAGGVSGRGADVLTRRGIVEMMGRLPTVDEVWDRSKLGGDSLQAKSVRSGSSPLGHFAGMWILRGGSSPATPPILAVQQRVEEALERRASELGVDVRRGHGLTGLEHDSTGVSLSVDGPAGPYELRTEWLVGCDGGRSLVRKAAGIGFPGVDGMTTGYQARATFDDPDFFPFGWHRTERGLLVRGPDPQRLVALRFDGPPADRNAPITREELQDVVRLLSGTDVTITEVASVNRFTDNTRQASAYRQGRILLAGDAAHVHPPFGGQGLHLGFGDAVNLGWKLALEIRGQAPEGLLDTYTTERHPVAARVIRNTRAQTALLAPGPGVDALREMFTALADTDEANLLLTDMMGELDVRYGSGDHPLTGLYCPDFALKTADGETRVSEASRTGRALLLDLADRGDMREGVRPWSDRVDVITGAGTDALAEAILVRPDGHVAWAGESVGALREAAVRWFGEPLAAG